MHGMHPELRRFDLNLLLVFDALYRHGSVTETAAAADMLLAPVKGVSGVQCR